MKKKIKLIWFIIKYGFEKFFTKNFEIYAPSIAGNSKKKGQITIDNINKIFPTIYLLIKKLGLKQEIVFSKSFCKNKKKIKQAIRLKKLFDFYGSDKSNFHDYHLIYSSLFENTLEVKKILEVGIGTNNINMLSNMGESGKPGASLMAFRDFFIKSKVYGADIDKEVLFEDKRIKTRYVDQTSFKSIKKLYKSFGGNFNLIVDDGLHSHTANLNLIIYSMGFLRKGGCLVIEDISLKSKSIWQTISVIVGFKYKCSLVKCKKSFIFLIYK